MNEANAVQTTIESAPEPNPTSKLVDNAVRANGALVSSERRRLAQTTARAEEQAAKARAERAEEEAKIAALEPREIELVALRERIEAADPKGLNVHLCEWVGEINRTLRRGRELRAVEAYRVRQAAIEPTLPKRQVFRNRLIDPATDVLLVATGTWAAVTIDGVIHHVEFPIAFVSPDEAAKVREALAAHPNPKILIFEGDARWDLAAIFTAANVSLPENWLGSVGCARSLDRWGVVADVGQIGGPIDEPRSPLARACRRAAARLGGLEDARRFWADAARKAAGEAVSP